VHNCIVNPHIFCQNPALHFFKTDLDPAFVKLIEKEGNKVKRSNRQGYLSFFVILSEGIRDGPVTRY
jgi:hypothetical protein